MLPNWSLPGKKNLAMIAPLSLVLLWAALVLPYLDFSLGRNEIEELFAVGRFRAGKYGVTLRFCHHPPLMHFLLFLWTCLGHSDLWLRLFSFIPMSAAIVLAYQWLRLSTSAWIAWVGCLSLIFGTGFHASMFGVFNYGVPTALVVAVFFLFESYCSSKTPPAQTLKWCAVLSGIASVSHYGTLLALLPVWFGVWLRFLIDGSAQHRKILKLWASWFLVFLPWLIYHRSRLDISISSYLDPFLFSTSKQTFLQFLAKGLEYYAANSLYPKFPVFLLAIALGIVVFFMSRFFQRGQISRGELVRVVVTITGPLIASALAGLLNFYPWGCFRNGFFLPFAFAYLFSLCVHWIWDSISKFRFIARFSFLAPGIGLLVAIGIAGLFLKVHPPNSWPLLQPHLLEKEQSRQEWLNEARQILYTSDIAAVVTDLHSMGHLWWYALPAELNLKIGNPAPERAILQMSSKFKINYIYSFVHGPFCEELTAIVKANQVKGLKISVMGHMPGLENNAEGRHEFVGCLNDGFPNLFEYRFGNSWFVAVSR